MQNRTREILTVYICVWHNVLTCGLGYTLHMLCTVVGIAARYGLDGPGFESRHGQVIFSPHKLSRLALEHTQLPIQWVPGFFLWGNVAGV
jgi:hypothetical protein